MYSLKFSIVFFCLIYTTNHDCDEEVSQEVMVSSHPGLSTMKTVENILSSSLANKSSPSSALKKNADSEGASFGSNDGLTDYADELGQKIDLFNKRLDLNHFGTNNDNSFTTSDDFQKQEKSLLDKFKTLTTSTSNKFLKKEKKAEGQKSQTSNSSSSSSSQQGSAAAGSSSSASGLSSSQQGSTAAGSSKKTSTSDSRINGSSGSFDSSSKSDSTLSKSGSLSVNGSASGSASGEGRASSGDGFGKSSGSFGNSGASGSGSSASRKKRTTSGGFGSGVSGALIDRDDLSDTAGSAGEFGFLNDTSGTDQIKSESIDLVNGDSELVKINPNEEKNFRLENGDEIVISNTNADDADIVLRNGEQVLFEHDGMKELISDGPDGVKLEKLIGGTGQNEFTTTETKYSDGTVETKEKDKYHNGVTVTRKKRSISSENAQFSGNEKVAQIFSLIRSLYDNLLMMTTKLKKHAELDQTYLLGGKKQKQPTVDLILLDIEGVTKEVQKVIENFDFVPEDQEKTVLELDGVEKIIPGKSGVYIENYEHSPSRSESVTTQKKYADGRVHKEETTNYNDGISVTKQKDSSADGNGYFLNSKKFTEIRSTFEIILNHMTEISNKLEQHAKSDRQDGITGDDGNYPRIESIVMDVEGVKRTMEKVIKNGE